MKTLFIFFVLFTTPVFAGIGVGESLIGPVPVELTSFTATLKSDIVELNWTTTTEVMNYGFEVEKSLTAIPLEYEYFTEWMVVGFVEGHGNSNSPKEYSFTDNIYNGFGYYSYRLKQIDADGKFSYSFVVSVMVNQIPDCFELCQNYPNPFNPSTVISYSIPKISHVVLSVYDVLGNLITTLVNEMQETGIYTAIFNAERLSNGIYYYRIQAGDFVSIKKMLVLK